MGCPSDSFLMFFALKSNWRFLKTKKKYNFIVFFFGQITIYAKKKNPIRNIESYILS